jgi:hypothetical protein
MEMKMGKREILLYTTVFLVLISFAIYLLLPKLEYPNPTHSVPVLKDLRLGYNQNSSQIKRFVLATKPPEVPEKLEAFALVSKQKSQDSFSETTRYNGRVEKPEQYQSEARKIAAGFLAEKGIKVDANKLTVQVGSVEDSSEQTGVGKPNKLVQTFQVKLEKELHGLPVLGAATFVILVPEGKVIEYRSMEYKTRSLGLFPIITPEQAVQLIPEYKHQVFGARLGETGYITQVSLVYEGFYQSSDLQPFYQISGYVDASNKDQFFVSIPAIKTGGNN